MHIAFLDANTDRSAFAARHSSEVAKFQALLAPVTRDWRYTAFKLPDGEAPETLTPDAFDGVIVSGSPASVHDDAPWVAGLLAMLRDAVAAGLPVFGACFGHQAVARALGGRVGRNPRGWVLGPVESQLRHPAPWSEACSVTLNAAHNEQVLTPPPGARVLGGTDATPYGHLAIGSTVFTTQYHPEITPDFMAGLIEELGSHDPADVPSEVIGNARSAMSKEVDNARMARWIADFFTQAHSV
ncbi:type 1 glutamine amidotransferase [Rhodobacter sp. NTK016B]|uniref:type 1 glutamine amidotransferase n=1 Tax=Rhodobacter sp. NTK016B TaxID=2759676 RepID=UPI001A8EC4F6|nr:type 1 glutamine amidotransferase [Rhodobacter sp. NTK016B]MBN8291313.1 type 1 glutamine amidotransferase [Rhodobacter sp. NTK016B]